MPSSLKRIVYNFPGYAATHYKSRMHDQLLMILFYCYDWSCKDEQAFLFNLNAYYSMHLRGPLSFTSEIDHHQLVTQVFTGLLMHQWSIHLNQACRSRETSKTCWTALLQEWSWTPPAYRMKYHISVPWKSFLKGSNWKRTFSFLQWWRCSSFFVDNGHTPLRFSSSFPDLTLGGLTCSLWPH